MRKLLFGLWICLIASNVFADDLTTRSATTTLNDTDLSYYMQNPSTTKDDKKITFANQKIEIFTDAADLDSTGAINNDAVALTTQTTGNYVASVATTSPLTGGAGGSEGATLTLDITVAKDIVTTAPLTGAEDNVLPGADADLTLAITVQKDLVTTAPVTGGTDNILTGSDADVTIALDFTAAWDFGGATSVELPNNANPTTDATGEIALDTTIIDHQPLWQYFDSGENMTIIAIDTAELPAQDNEIVKYDAGTDKFVLEADTGGGGVAFFRNLAIHSGKIGGSDITLPMLIDGGNRPWNGIFDDSQDEQVTWQFNADGYATGTLSLIIDFYVEDTQTGGDQKTVIFDGQFMAATPDTDAEDFDTDGFAAIQSATETLATNQTAGHPRQVTITFTQAQADALADGDIFRFRLNHDSSDTVVGNVRITSVFLKE